MHAYPADKVERQHQPCISGSNLLIPDRRLTCHVEAYRIPDPVNLHLIYPFTFTSLPPHNLYTMPPPTSSLKPNAKKETNGAPALAPVVGTGSTGEKSAPSSKPDQAKYNAEQDSLNKEIAVIKTKLVSIQSVLVVLAVRSGWSRCAGSGACGVYYAIRLKERSSAPSPTHNTFSGGIACLPLHTCLGEEQAVGGTSANFRMLFVRESLLDNPQGPTTAERPLKPRWTRFEASRASSRRTVLRLWRRLRGCRRMCRRRLRMLRRVEESLALRMWERSMSVFSEWRCSPDLLFRVICLCPSSCLPLLASLFALDSKGWIPVVLPDQSRD
jgi:hypothetical protein